MEIQERQYAAESELGNDIPPELKKIYAARGVLTEQELRLDLGDLLPPSLLKNNNAAAALLFNAMKQGKKILVVGDFDADGATSSALFLLCLKAFAYEHVDYLVPNRFEYGYGLTPEIVAVATQLHPELIVTVDNGIASLDGVARAREAGIEVLITDHHLPGTSLPDADCILNPNLPDCEFPSKALAGVGVVFYLMTALRIELRKHNWFEEQGIEEPNLAGFLDLVALGTVADVVPLDQNNRRLVKHGLSVIRSGRGRPGIRALLEVAGRNPQTVIASDLAFTAGPRLNAAGRLDDMSVGIECLLAEDNSRAKQLALKLDGLNKDRRQIEQAMKDQALETLKNLDVSGEGQLGICLFDADWHQGVIGILASRVKEKFHRPCIVFAEATEDGESAAMIKGSARSIEGLHIRDVLDAVATNNPGLLDRFGGHAMAAGLAIKLADYKTFCLAFEEELNRVMDRNILKQLTLIDGELPAERLTLDFASQLREAGPWGQHFPEPVFKGEFSVINNRVVGEKHLKMTLQAMSSETLIDAIAFNVDPDILHKELESVSLVYRLDVNEFRGVSNPQLLVEEIIAFG